MSVELDYFMASGKRWVLAHFYIICTFCYCCSIAWVILVNSSRPRPNRRHFADGIFKCIFENENEWISPRISLKFVPKVQINNIPALVQIMAWRRPGDKPLSEPMMVSLLTHICVTRPQWVKLEHISALYMKQWLIINSLRLSDASVIYMSAT